MSDLKIGDTSLLTRCRLGRNKQPGNEAAPTQVKQMVTVNYYRETKTLS